MIELGANRYGKAAIRIVRVGRDTTPHRLRDITVAIALEGDFAPRPHRRRQLAGRRHRHDEEHGVRLRGGAPRRLDRGVCGRAGRHFLGNDQVDRAIVNVREHGWRPLDVGGAPAPDAFVRTGEGTRVATVAVGRDGTVVEAGIEDLIVMKTTRSGSRASRATGTRRSQRPTDRIMATKITAIWTYGAPDLDFDATWAPSTTRSSRSSPITTARASRRRSGSWPRRCWNGTRSSTRCGWCCPICTTGRSTSGSSGSTTTARLHLDDRAARADRGDRPSLGRCPDDARRRGHGSAGRRRRTRPDRRRAGVRRRPPAPVRPRAPRPAPPPRTNGRPSSTPASCPTSWPARATSAPATGRSHPRRPTSTTGGSRSPARPSRR